MGYGQYDLQAHQAATKARAELPSQAVFKEGACHPSMRPYMVDKRESRDSPQHPNSVGIVFALDVSGSMGEIPKQLATKTLPQFMENVLTVLPDPQVLFIAFGNAYSDRSPLQVGQFESEAPLIDKWLALTHLEGAGGGLGESYDLAMYFASRHTVMDCLEKRKKKGYFFMTGDEVPFADLDAPKVRQVIGSELGQKMRIDQTAAELLRSFHAFFLIPDKSRALACEGSWEKIFSARCIVLETPEDTAIVCALLIAIQEGQLKDAASIRKRVEEKMGRTGAERDRVVRAVVPFAEALAAGKIHPPIEQGSRPPDPSFVG